MSCGVVWTDEFFKVHWCAAMDTLIGQEADLIVNPGPNREPMEVMKDGCDVFKFTHPHQDPGSTVLNVLQSLQTPARDPDEECITVVQPGGDKGMDQLLSIREGEGGTEFGDVPEVKESSFTDMLDMDIE